MVVTLKSKSAEARQFLGTLEDAENIKEWLEGIEVSWAPLDDQYNDPTKQEPDLSKGVALDVVGTLGYQEVLKGDWIMRDEMGAIVMADEYFKYYYYEED